MSTDEPFIPPKKKPNVLWWIAGGLAFLVFIFFLQLFGPNSPIVVSPQTTHITSPLGPNGLPDYERYLLEKSRKGVTPENNAAVLIWQALWPGELDAPQYAAVATELGLEMIPSADEALVRLHSKSNEEALRSWLRQQGVLPTATDAENQEGGDIGGNELIEQTINWAMHRPWTSEECPPLAKWVAENKRPLDMLLEASERPRCYFPSPTLLNRTNESLIQVLIPGVQSAREVGRSLPARAMWHLGEGRVADAWQDLLATHRAARLTGQGNFVVEQLVAMAIDGMASDGTLALLDQGKLTPEQARTIHRDLAKLANFSAMADSLNASERLAFIDAVIQFDTVDDPSMRNDMGISGDVSLLNTVSVDWNIVLRTGNQFFDRYAAAAQLPERNDRDQAYRQIQNDLQRLQQVTREPATLAAGVVSRRRRAEIVSAVMLNLFLPALEAATNAQDRANSRLELLRLSAALAVYRAEHGAYPEKLDELVPGVVQKLPVDLYNAKPYIYKRTDDGYLLYTTSENGVDDGGSHKMYRTLNGRSLDDFDLNQAETMESQIPDGADDFSIRVPTPKWAPPKLPEAVGP